MDDLYNSIIALNPSSQMILKDGIVTNNTSNTPVEQQYISQTALLENALNNVEGYQNYYYTNNYKILYIAIISVIIIYLISIKY